MPDPEDWKDAWDYDVATNAAGGGTRHRTDLAYDVAGNAGEGTSTGPATSYESASPVDPSATGDDEATYADPDSNFATAGGPGTEGAVDADDLTDVNADYDSPELQRGGLTDED